MVPDVSGCTRRWVDRESKLRLVSGVMEWDKVVGLVERKEFILCIGRESRERRPVGKRIFE